MFQLINLTPHDINIVEENGSIIMTLPRTDVVARVEQKLTSVNEINGISIKESCWGDIVGLPGPEENVFYIVSALVANAAKEQGRTKDILCPCDFVRDGEGRVIGAKALMHV